MINYGAAGLTYTVYSVTTVALCYWLWQSHHVFALARGLAEGVISRQNNMWDLTRRGKKGSAKKFPLTTDESENNVRAHLPHRLAKTFFSFSTHPTDALGWPRIQSLHCHRESFFFRHQLNHGYARISPGFRQMVRSNKTWIRLNWIDSIKTRTNEGSSSIRGYQHAWKRPSACSPTIFPLLFSV